jgi:hypothetical protein
MHLNCEDMVTLLRPNSTVTRHDGGTINPPTAPVKNFDV